MNILKAIYNFIVGDMVILLGVLLTVLVLVLLDKVSALAPLRVISGPLLILAILGILFATLFRETQGRRTK